MPLNQNEVHAGMLTLQIERDGDRHCIRLVGELDLANADALDAELSEAMSRDRPVLVDMRDLTFIDSTGIALLVRALSRDPGGEQLSFLPSEAPAVVRVLRLTGVAERLPLDDAA